ncbi:MAG: cation transporter [Candidatus Daviesbacteria bacterium]|nr:cation transporter [Candidatus Daviesbacteria bacterium]
MKKKFKITGMHCSSCAMTIDMDLEDLEGVKKSQTSYAKAETEVEFDQDKISDNLILETIKKSGYTASTVN